MKYADYKIENLVFLKKETDTWSLEEKKEFLETCPENAGLKDTIEQLKEISQAIEDGVVKVNRYHEINKNSLKAYLANKKTNIRYGQPSRRYYYMSDTKDFYFMVDGDYEYVTRSYNIDGIIEKYESDKCIEHRFNALSNNYFDKEQRWAKQIETESYEALHADRIKANKKLDKVLGSLRIDIPLSINETTGWYVECSTECFSTFDFPYSRNYYGEVTVNNVPLTETQATELTNTVLEMSAKINEIIKEYKDTIGAALGKARERK